MRDYIDYITPTHLTADKFVQHINLITRSFIDVATQSGQLNALFSIDYGNGPQLDAVGEWIGLARYIKTPITGAYFALDTQDVGFDQGSWKRRFDADSGFTELDDDTYRSILRAKIRANHWDGTCAMLADIYQGVIPDESIKIFFTDNQDMSMDVYLTSGVVAEVIKAVIRQGYLNIKPEGVKVNNYIGSEGDNGIFGLDVSNEFIAGFDTGSWAVKL